MLSFDYIVLYNYYLCSLHNSVGFYLTAILLSFIQSKVLNSLTFTFISKKDGLIDLYSLFFILWGNFYNLLRDPGPTEFNGIFSSKHHQT